jgi:DNA-binding transcriptional ArsR family regulator
VADVDGTLAALADPGRRAIIELLQERPRRPSDIAESLEMTRPAMSRHLRVLRAAGLVEQETSDEDARARPISLRREPFTQLRQWLEEVEAFWTEELAAFKAYAERKHGSLEGAPAAASARPAGQAPLRAAPRPGKKAPSAPARPGTKGRR